MLILLVITFTLLALGALVTFLLDRRWPRYTLHAPPIVAGLLALTWFLSKGNLPLTLVYGDPGSQPIFSGWSLMVDEKGWQLTMILLLLFTAIFLGSLGWDFGEQASSASDERVRRAAPMALLVIAPSLLTIWSATIYSLMVSWTIFIGSWLVLLILIDPERQQIRSNILRGGFALLAVFFLWLSAALLGSQSATAFNLSGASSGAIIWALLASYTLVGLIFLQWWRPFEEELSPMLDSLIYILPIVAGGQLFLLLITDNGIGSVHRYIISVICLLGLLVGTVLAWMRISKPTRFVPIVSFTVVHLFVLDGVWNGAESALTYLRIATLGMAGFFVAVRIIRAGPIWLRGAALVFAAGVGGFPLTAGQEGLLGLYATWLEGGHLILIVAAASLIAILMGAIFSVFWPKRKAAEEHAMAPPEHGLIAASFIILLAGVVSIGNFQSVSSNLAALAIVLASVGVGFAFSRSAQRAVEVEAMLQNALDFDLPINRIRSSILAVLAFPGSFFRDWMALMEGERGMIWILVLLVVLWLAVIV